MCETYITTSIPYVNAEPHVGFALELVQADVIARINRLLGKRVVFQTGTDENAIKNVLAAEKLGIAPPNLANQNASRFYSLIKALNCSTDTFIRTTESRHHRGMQALWHRLSPNDLYKKSCHGLYCSACEDLLPADGVVPWPLPRAWDSTFAGQRGKLLLPSLIISTSDRTADCRGKDRYYSPQTQERSPQLHPSGPARHLYFERCAAIAWMGSPSPDGCVEDNLRMD